LSRAGRRSNGTILLFLRARRSLFSSTDTALATVTTNGLGIDEIAQVGEESRYASALPNSIKIGLKNNSQCILNTAQTK